MKATQSSVKREIKLGKRDKKYIILSSQIINKNAIFKVYVLSAPENNFYCFKLPSVIIYKNSNKKPIYQLFSCYWWW